MGHERIAVLPRTVPWRQVVSAVAQAADGTEADVAAIAGDTLQLVRARFSEVHCDSGVQAAFGFLLAVARAQSPTEPSRAAPPITLPSTTTPLRLISSLNQWVEDNAASREYAEIAKRSAAEALATWHQEHSRQPSLFSDHKTHSTSAVWDHTANAAVFSEVSRIFFASFTERYVKYFLEREASGAISDINKRDRFSERIHSSIQSLSKHAFETAKITQSFSAGWYNNHALTRTPSNAKISNFLRISFGKLGEELRREALK